MLRKKLVLLFGVFGLVVLCLFAGINVSVSTISVCGCGTINGWVWGDLKELDAKINQFAAAHHGLFPTYSEAVALYLTVDPDTYGPDMTPAIDVVTGNLTGKTVPKTIAYSVSADRRAYVLRGIGWNEKFGHFFLFGLDFGEHKVGYEFPILKASDPEPRD